MPSKPVIIDQSTWDKVKDLNINHNIGIASLVKRFKSSGLNHRKAGEFLKQARMEAGLPPLKDCRKQSAALQW